MEKLPPEILLEIARNCNFADLCQLTRASPAWNEVIESNWHTLERKKLKCLYIDERSGDKEFLCGTKTKGFNVKLYQGLETTNAYDALIRLWEDLRIDSGFTSSRLESKDVERFAGDFFSPIFKKCSIAKLSLDSLTTTALQTLVVLSERYHTPIDYITLSFHDEYAYDLIRHDPQELSECARIIELSKPHTLRVSLSQQFSGKEVQELLLDKIANMHIEDVGIKWNNLCGRCKTGEHREHFEDVDIDESAITTMHLQGPLPKCELLICEGDRHKGVSALTVSGIVDLIEEWSRNERFIENYELRYFSKPITHVAAEFKCELLARNLSIRLEVVKENVEFVIRKIPPCEGDQNIVRMVFQWQSPDQNAFDDADHINKRMNFVFIEKEAEMPIDDTYAYSTQFFHIPPLRCFPIVRM